MDSKWFLAWAKNCKLGHTHVCVYGVCVGMGGHSMVEVAFVLLSILSSLIHILRYVFMIHAVRHTGTVICIIICIIFYKRL